MAMKAIIARKLFVVVVIFQYHTAVAIENNRALFSQCRDKRGAILQKNGKNNLIYQFPHDQQKTVVNVYDSLAITEQDNKHSLDKREPAKVTFTNTKRQNTHKSVPTTHRSLQNIQQLLSAENKTFFNKFDKTIQNYRFHKIEEKSKRDTKTTIYDALMPESSRATKITFGSSPTLSESRILNNLSSELNFGHGLFFYNKIKRREKKENFADSNGVELLSKTTFLLPTILNVLRKELVVHPFEMWNLKHKFNSTKNMRVHEDTLHEVIRNPWNKKLKHQLYKVLQGEDVYLDVFGGSNSAGAGLKVDEGNIDGRFSNVIIHWWNKTITPITGSKLKLREIAIGGTSCEFFQLCFASYIHEKLDLVFIEMAVNDMRDLPSNANKSLPLEQLTRQLLTYPTEPALVYINLFKGLFCNKGCTNMEDYGQDFLTDTYNITTLKWRNAVCVANASNHNLKSPCNLIASDKMHINQLGHAHISLMIINLFRRILLDHISSVVTNSSVSHWENPTRVSRRIAFFDVRNQLSSAILRKQIGLPRPVLIKKTTNIISEPLCWTNLYPNYHRVKDIKNNLDVIIAKSKDFFLETSKIGEKCTKPPCRMDSVSSWTGKTVGANITFFFIIPGRNSSLSAEKIQTRSVAVGIRTCPECGGADMWLDSDYKQKKFFSTRLHYGQTRARIIALHVKPGNHSLDIEIVREGKVSIVAIMVGPSDGPY